MWVTLEEKINGLYHIGFDEAELKLTQVIVGCQSGITRSQVSEALGDIDVKAFKSRAAFKSFKVLKNQNKNMWR